MTVDACDFAESIELHFHQSGHRRVVATEPQRPPLADEFQRAATKRAAKRTGGRRRLPRLVAADATAVLARSHEDPRHLIQFAPPFGIDGLEGDAPVGRHFDEERAVGGKRHRAQFFDFASGMNDIGVGRPHLQARTGQHADGPDMRPTGSRVLRKPRVLAEEQSGRPGLVALFGSTSSGIDAGRARGPKPTGEWI